MQISEDGRTATLGSVNLTAFVRYRSSQQASSVSDVLAWRSDAGVTEQTTWGRYGISWLLVHFLFNTQPAALAKFETMLAAGADPGLAWSRAFPDIASAMFDQQIDVYSRYGRMMKVERPIPSVTVVPVKKAITAADVLAIRAQLALVGASGASSRTRVELGDEFKHGLERALALEPGNALAVRLLQTVHAPVERGTMTKGLRTQVERRPDDGDAWLLLGNILDEGTAEREAAFRRAVLLMPRSAEAYNALAWVLVLSKRGEAALPLAAKAALLAPWDAEVIDTYAATLFAVGRCPDALSTQKRALDLVPETTADSSMTPALTTRLEVYRRACGQTSDERAGD